MNNMLLSTVALIGFSSINGTPINEILNIKETKENEIEKENNYNCYILDSNLTVKVPTKILEMYSLDDNHLNYLSFNMIRCDNKTINLNKTIYVKYSKVNNFIAAEKEELGMCCWGKDVNELQEDIQENLNVLFEMYVNCDINELTIDAQTLRNKLMGYLN